MVACFQAMQAHPVLPMVRVPWNEPGICGKVLDAGAYGVICPMINTVEAAQAFVSYCRYPPAGDRSNGPIRAGIYGVSTGYQKTANEEVLCIPMIETKEAIANLDAILDVPGIDAVYIGPSDLGFSHGLIPILDREEPEMLAIIESVATQGATRPASRPASIAAAPPMPGAPSAWASSSSPSAATRPSSPRAPAPRSGRCASRERVHPPARGRRRGDRAHHADAGHRDRPGVVTDRAHPAGHKAAVRGHAPGEAVRRYGQVIGIATQPIAPGAGSTRTTWAWATTTTTTPGAWTAGRRRWPTRSAQLPGHPPPDGRIATRNYIGILTSVNCSAHVAGLVATRSAAARSATGPDPLADFPNVDGVVALTHKTGLRHDGRRAAAPVAPHAGRLRAARELQPRRGAGPGLRGEPARLHDERDRPRRARPQHGHPGHGRHPQDGGGRDRLRAGGAGRRPTPCTASPARPAN